MATGSAEDSCSVVLGVLEAGLLILEARMGLVRLSSSTGAALVLVCLLALVNSLVVEYPLPEFARKLSQILQRRGLEVRS